MGTYPYETGLGGCCRRGEYKRGLGGMTSPQRVPVDAQGRALALDPRPQTRGGGGAGGGS